MEPEVTVKQSWLAIYGPQGGECIPLDLTNILTLNYEGPAIALDYFGIGDYFENRVATSIQTTYGYGVRLSMPGYLDCTPWRVYPTLREARRAARELSSED
jgi:hypothetical protein